MINPFRKTGVIQLVGVIGEARYRSVSDLVQMWVYGYIGYKDVVDVVKGGAIRLPKGIKPIIPQRLVDGDVRCFGPAETVDSIMQEDGKIGVYEERLLGLAPVNDPEFEAEYIEKLRCVQRLMSAHRAGEELPLEDPTVKKKPQFKKRGEAETEPNTEPPEEDWREILASPLLEEPQETQENDISVEVVEGVLREYLPAFYLLMSGENPEQIAAALDKLGGPVERSNVFTTILQQLDAVKEAVGEYLEICSMGVEYLATAIADLDGPASVAYPYSSQKKREDRLAEVEATRATQDENQRHRKGNNGNNGNNGNQSQQSQNPVQQPQGGQVYMAEPVSAQSKNQVNPNGERGARKRLRKRLNEFYDTCDLTDAEEYAMLEIIETVLDNGGKSGTDRAAHYLWLHSQIVDVRAGSDSDKLKRLRALYEMRKAALAKNYDLFLTLKRAYDAVYDPNYVPMDTSDQQVDGQPTFSTDSNGTTGQKPAEGADDLTEESDDRSQTDVPQIPDEQDADGSTNEQGNDQGTGAGDSSADDNSRSSDTAKSDASSVLGLVSVGKVRQVFAMFGAEEPDIIKPLRDDMEIAIIFAESLLEDAGLKYPLW